MLPGTYPYRDKWVENWKNYAYTYLTLPRRKKKIKLGFTTTKI
jgi:hypothetical protein